MQDIFLIIKFNIAPVDRDTENPMTRPKLVKPKSKPTGSGPNKPEISLRDQDSEGLLTRPKPIKPKPKPTGSGPNKPKIAFNDPDSRKGPNCPAQPQPKPTPQPIKLDDLNQWQPALGVAMIEVQ
ncbi:hypothetical protein MCOR25_003668 [Pyricularia grisea]|uniref:Uncharacterized protein n=1 Tax=Pyricularia grisea TaxID=148305 RepID=A0A6P8B0U9_PYRGI|nr:uncharacterized protein PgNI_07460 [Pyricularia grisea]KAI6372702.1 hypothetical protein MCOR25_003668 [Pyricularia grisea]TLD08343.1 hypothetical protein PgNI_07460 [Pyricularia grisea]